MIARRGPTAAARAFLDAGTAPLPVWHAVAFRVVLGLWTVGFLLPRAAYADELVARPTLRDVPAVWRWLGDPVPPVPVAQALIAGTALLCVLFALGVRPRRTHVGVLVGLSLLFAMDRLMIRAYGSLAYVQWWLLWLAPYDEPARDADGRLRVAPGAGVWILRGTLVSVYAFAVVAKVVDGKGWLSGVAVGRALAAPRYGRFLLSSWIDVGPGLSRLLSWGTLVTETLIALGLLFARGRAAAGLLLVGLHVGIGLTMRVSPLFHLLMVGHLVLFFAPASVTSDAEEAADRHGGAEPAEERAPEEEPAGGDERQRSQLEDPEAP